LTRIGFSRRAVESSARNYPAALPTDDVSNNPNLYVARALVGLTYLEKGFCEEAITELRGALTVRDNREALALLGYAFAVSGRIDEARKRLEELQEAATKEYVDPVFI